MVTYGVSQDQAFAVGLTCGGIMELFVQPVNAATSWAAWLNHLRAGR